MKRFFSIILGLMLMLTSFGALAGCGGGSDELVVWAHTNEVRNLVNNYYKKAFPDKKVRVEVYISDIFQTKLDGVLGTGSNVPDVVVMQMGFIQKYINKGSLMSMSSDGLNFAGAAAENMFQYTVDAATGADGKLYGVSWQAIPGGYFYRRSVAKMLWGEGNDTPEFVQTKMDTWEHFMETAELLKRRGAQNRILSSLNGDADVFLSQKEDYWIKDNALQVGSFVGDYFNHVYRLQKGITNSGEQLGLFVNETSEFTSGWFTDMSNKNVFGFFLPAWGMQFYLKEYCGDTWGDWGLVRGPQTYVSGGSWLSAYSGTKKKEEAKHLLEYLTFNEEYLTTYAQASGEFVNNVNVVNTLKTDFAEPFLGGQNHYELFSELVQEIDGTKVGPYDTAIYSIFKQCSIDYATGQQGYDSVDKTITNFKALMRNSFPTLTIN